MVIVRGSQGLFGAVRGSLGQSGAIRGSLGQSGAVRGSLGLSWEYSGVLEYSIQYIPILSPEGSMDLGGGSDVEVELQTNRAEITFQNGVFCAIPWIRLLSVADPFNTPIPHHLLLSLSHTSTWNRNHVVQSITWSERVLKISVMKTRYRCGYMLLPKSRAVRGSQGAVLEYSLGVGG